jgi:hypothetical protein
VEAHDGLFPDDVEVFEFCLVGNHYFFMELVKLDVLQLVALLVFDAVLNEQLVDLGFKQESDIYQVLAQLV